MLEAGARRQGRTRKDVLKVTSTRGEGTRGRAEGATGSQTPRGAGPAAEAGQTQHRGQEAARPAAGRPTWPSGDVRSRATAPSRGHGGHSGTRVMVSVLPLLHAIPGSPDLPTRVAESPVPLLLLSHSAARCTCVLQEMAEPQKPGLASSLAWARAARRRQREGTPPPPPAPPPCSRGPASHPTPAFPALTGAEAPALPLTTPPPRPVPDAPHTQGPSEPNTGKELCPGIHLVLLHQGWILSCRTNLWGEKALLSLLRPPPPPSDPRGRHVPGQDHPLHQGNLTN